MLAAKESSLYSAYTKTALLFIRSPAGWQSLSQFGKKSPEQSCVLGTIIDILGRRDVRSGILNLITLPKVLLSMLPSTAFVQGKNIYSGALRRGDVERAHLDFENLAHPTPGVLRSLMRTFLPVGIA